MKAAPVAPDSAALLADDFATVNRLVTENIALAKFFAAKWRETVGESEALSLALEGLHGAAQTYDPTKGIPFGSWASIRIKWTLNQRHKANKAVKRGGRVQHVSMDAPLGEEGTATLSDLVADDNAESAAAETEFTDTSRHLRELISTLPERAGQILSLRYGLDGSAPQTLEVIGEKFGVSRERVRQIEEAALDTLAKKQGNRRVKKQVRAASEPAASITPPASRAVKTDLFDPANLIPAKVQRRRQSAQEYRERNRESIRCYMREWRQRNRDALRAYQERWALRAKAWRAAWYARHRLRLCRAQRERYLNDPAYAEGAKARAKLWRERNPQQYVATKEAYRANHREHLREQARKFSVHLASSYVRRQLWHRHGKTRPLESFTFEEIATYRAYLAQRRQDLAGRPPCPTCGKPGRKDGHFTPSGNPRFSCRRCRVRYGMSGPPSPRRGTKKVSR